MLCCTMQDPQQIVLQCNPILIHFPLHSLEPGEKILIKAWKAEPLQPKCEGSKKSC